MPKNHVKLKLVSLYSLLIVGILNVSNLVIFAKARYPIFSTEFGIVRLVRFVLVNAYSGIALIVPSGNVILFALVQSLKISVANCVVPSFTT